MSQKTYKITLGHLKKIISEVSGEISEAVPVSALDTLDAAISRGVDGIDASLNDIKHHMTKSQDRRPYTDIKLLFNEIRSTSEVLNRRLTRPSPSSMNEDVPGQKSNAAPPALPVDEPDYDSFAEIFKDDIAMLLEKHPAFDAGVELADIVSAELSSGALENMALPARIEDVSSTAEQVADAWMKDRHVVKGLRSVLLHLAKKGLLATFK